MSDNPYSKPQSGLGGGDQSAYVPSILSFNGRIGRLRYLAYGFGLSVGMVMVGAPFASMLAGFFGPDLGSSIGVILFGLMNIAVVVLSIFFGKRRLNDLNRSGWWLAQMMVPLLNIALAVYLLFFPGSEGPNDYGPCPIENSLGVKVLALMLPVLFLVGVVTAVAVPAFLQFANPLIG